MPHLGSQHCCGLLLLLYSQEARGGSSSCYNNMMLRYKGDDCQYAFKLALVWSERTLDTVEIKLPSSEAKRR
jgi:hypothetical protein